MTDDEKQSMLAEKLDNILSRLILARRERDTQMIKKYKTEAKRILAEIEIFVTDL